MKQQDYEFHFAPLQGCTDHIFRNAFAKYFGGVDVYYTPFIRIEKETFRRRDVRDIEPGLNRVPHLIPQILPGTKSEFQKMSDLLLEKGYREADINLGCPFPLIAGKKKGSGMLSYPTIVADVLQMIDNYPEISFSVKMRLGWFNDDECLELADILNSLPLRHIMVHARTGKQQYKGEVRMDAFSKLEAKITHPLIYNGDLFSVEDIQHVLVSYPTLKGVAMARGLLANPFLIQDFKGVLEPDKKAVLLEFHNEIFSEYADVLQGDVQLLMRMKSIWEYFLPGSERKLLKQIKKSNKISQYIEAVNLILH